MNGIPSFPSNSLIFALMASVEQSEKRPVKFRSAGRTTLAALAFAYCFQMSIPAYGGAPDFSASAVYDSRTGRIVMEALNLHYWHIHSPGNFFTGPDDVETRGVLPTGDPNDVIVTNLQDVIGEFHLRGGPITFAPLDLGRVAQTNIPKGELYLEYGYGNRAFSVPLQYVPEPSGIFLAALVLFMQLHRNRMPKATS